MLVNSSDQLRTLSVINVAGLSLGHEEFPHFNFFAKNWVITDAKEIKSVVNVEMFVTVLNQKMT